VSADFALLQLPCQLRRTVDLSRRMVGLTWRTVGFGHWQWGLWLVSNIRQ